MQIPVHAILAHVENYSSTDTCAVCLTCLGLHAHRLGVPTVHTTGGGAQHPMHRACFLEAVRNSGSCPICRTGVPLEAFVCPIREKSFTKRLTDLSLLFAGASAYHFAFTLLTHAPKLVAAAPGIVTFSLVSGKNYFEHTELGLEHSVKVEIITTLVLSTIIIAIPTLSAIAAERVMQSPFSNSCLTAALTVTGFFLLKELTVSKQKDPGHL